jgi:hypothetical protein
MTMLVVLVGDYDEYTEHYIRRLIADDVKVVDSTFDVLDTPCPLTIVSTDMKTMSDWIYRECIDRVWGIIEGYDDIVVLPYLHKFDDDAFRQCLNRRTKYDKLNMECRVYCADIIDDLIPTNKNVMNTTVFGIKAFSCRTHPLIPPPITCPSGDIVCVCVPSIIHVKDPKRSLFSAEERLQHTLRQLKSIKRFVPNSYVVLLEMSLLSPLEMHRLSSVCDMFWSFHDDPILQSVAHVDPNKNKAEVYVLEKAFNFLHASHPNITHFAKFGGRYWFVKDATSLFTIRPVMRKVYATCANQYIIEPVFYSIPTANIEEFIKTLRKMWDTLDHTFTDNERLLWFMFANHRDIYSPDCQYIQGYTATSAVFRYF